MADCGRAGKYYQRFALCHLLTFRSLIKCYCALSHVDMARPRGYFEMLPFYDTNGKYCLASHTNIFISRTRLCELSGDPEVSLSKSGEVYFPFKSYVI